MKNRAFILLLAAHITILTLPGFPQEGRGLGRLVGTVTDEAEKPLADVKILMKSTSYDFQKEAVSDSKGKWSFIGFAKDIFEEFLVLRPEDPQADAIRQIIGTLKK